MNTHVEVYREPGRYAGWPANYGIWSWEDEIVVGFTLGYHDSEGGFHTRDRSRAFVGMQARSLGGGVTWSIQETPCESPGGRGLSADEHMNSELGVGDALSEEGSLPQNKDEIDFTHPDLALMCARSGLRAGAVSWFYYSTDRCRSWQGPFGLPDFAQTGIAARTDYLVSTGNTCTLFLTAAKPDGKEGQVFCARTGDGGRSFEFLSWISPEPEGFQIMPASARLPNGRILVAVRCRGGKRDQGNEQNWIDLYATDDDCRTWSLVGQPVDQTGRGGNPPTLTELSDGRLCLTYGYRDEPYRICAKLSSDDGETWSETVLLRDQGGCHDIGYPRTVQRPDGKIVTVYYFTDSPDGERYLAATIWDPPA